VQITFCFSAALYIQMYTLHAVRTICQFVSSVLRQQHTLKKKSLKEDM